MAVNTVSIIGDQSYLHVYATNLTGAFPLEFLSGSFRGTVEERRVASIFLVINDTEFFEVRLEFSDQAFTTTDIKGKSLKSTSSDTEGIRL